MAGEKKKAEEPLGLYRVEFIDAVGEDLALKQTGRIALLDKEGWDWYGFASTTEAVALCAHGDWAACSIDDASIGVGSRTNGVLLYFKRRSPRDQIHAAMGGAPASRAQRRREQLGRA